MPRTNKLRKFPTLDSLRKDFNNDHHYRNGYYICFYERPTKTSPSGEEIEFFDVHLSKKVGKRDWHYVQEKVLDTTWPARGASSGELNYFLREVAQLPKVKIPTHLDIAAEFEVDDVSF